MAAAELERALAIRPDSVEALRLLGMVLASQKRYAEALVRLGEARRLDPKNADVRLGIARTLSWSGDFAAAEREVTALLAERPDNLEAQVFKARLAYFQGRHKQAERVLISVLERDRRNLDALVLLGDVKQAMGNSPAARGYYDRAFKLAPDSPEIARKLSRTRETPWRIDTGYNFSNFSRESRSDWHEGFVQLRRALGQNTGVLGRVEVNRRFGETDVFLAGGADHRFNTWFSGYALFGGTPNADFMQRWSVAAGGAARLWPGGDALGATVGTLDYEHSDYDTGAVDTLSPGLQQYFLSGRTWLTARWINTFNEDNDWDAGWLARLDWQALDELGLYAGAADAAETVDGVTVDTLTFFAGVIVNLDSSRSLRFDYLRDDREDSYIRDSFGVAFSQRF